jgi:tetratricopeptide (TPR) repeat protein
VASSRPAEALERLSAFAANHPEAEILLQMGVLQETLGKTDDAIATYEKLLAANPNAVAALNNLAALYAERKDRLDRALSLAEAARRLNPNSAVVADTLGWILFQKGEYDRALTLLQESAPKLGADPRAAFHLGITLYLLGQDEPARQALQRAAQVDPKSAEAKQALRLLAVLAIDPKTADQTAVADLEKISAEYPKDTTARSRLAAIYERNGAIDKAASTYEALLSVNPNNSTVLKRLMGLYASKPETQAKALEIAKKAHDIAPEDAEISRTLAHLCLDQNPDYKWILSLLQEAARKLPDRPDLLYDLARAYYGVGRVNEAEASAQAALKAGSFPGSDEARLFLTLVTAAKDPAQAVQVAAQADQALKAAPDYIPALVISATVARQQGKIQQTKALFEKAYALNPLFAPAARELVLINSSQPTPDATVSELSTKAREAFPDDPILAKALGILNYGRGEHAQALRFLQEAASKRDQDAQLLYYLGMTHFRLEAAQDAKQALQKALTLGLSGDLAKDAQDVLTKLK